MLVEDAALSILETMVMGLGGQLQLTPRQGHQGHQGHGPLKLEFLNSFDLQNTLESFKHTDS